MFNDHIVAINDQYRLYMDEVDALDKSDINNEFLSMKLLDLRKQSVEQRKSYEKKIFDIYKTFRYPGSFYKMTEPKPINTFFDREKRRAERLS